MRLSRLGELAAVERVAGLCAKPGREVAVGIGDDAAVFRAGKGVLTLVSTDMLVEGVHFDLSYTGFMELGFKALAVNLSDIAAMGGRPKHYLVSLALPGETPVECLDGLYRGMESLASEHSVRAIGGDTCASPGPVVINITILGRALPGRVVRRSGARPGDDLYVTGTLGDAAAGLELLKTGARGQGKGRDKKPVSYLVSRHLTPTPRVTAGRLLAERGLVSSMIDVSDGLSSDLGHLLRQSGVGALVYPDRLPLSDDIRAVFGYGKAVSYALHGGEDYELLFTAGPGARKAIERLQDRAGTAFTVIGSIVRGNGASLAPDKGPRRALTPKGYEHFKK